MEFEESQVSFRCLVGTLIFHILTNLDPKNDNIKLLLINKLHCKFIGI